MFKMTIHEIEEAMDICDNKPFVQSGEKFSRLEEFLNISLNVFEVTLLPGYDDNFNEKNEHFTSSQIYSGHKSTSVLSLCILNHTQPMIPWDSDIISKHFMFIKDFADFKRSIYS